jgi:hypothetical protein
VIIDDITPAAPLVPVDMLDRGWWVGEYDHTFIIEFADGRPAIIGDTAAMAFISAQQPVQEDNIMPSKQANYIDEAADEVTGLISKYADPALTFIGQSAKSAAEINRTKRPWSDLARSETIGRVTLDLDPEVKGRPQPGRPGVDQVVFLCLPSWHPLFKAGIQEVAAVLYRPATTYEAQRIEKGRVVREPRASSYDVTGWIGIVDYFGSFDAAEQERTDLWEAVKATSKSLLSDADMQPDEDYDPLAGRYGSAASWGV